MPYAVFRPTFKLPRILKSLPLAVVFFSAVVLSSCQSEPSDYYLDDFLKSGQQTLVLDSDQSLIINQENRAMTLKVSLGRKEKKLAHIEEQDGIQKQIRFTQSGNYQITISSDERSSAPNQFQQTINVQVR